LTDVAFLFQNVGVIDYTPGDLDAIMDFAIENDALDVQEHDWGHRIICEREAFLNLREAMETAFGPAKQAALCWKGIAPHVLSEEKKISIMKLIHVLEDLDDVQTVWTNADDDLEALRQDSEEDDASLT
jgi:transcriptional/translational regulatory protein YebC/TACO1